MYIPRQKWVVQFVLLFSNSHSDLAECTSYSESILAVKRATKDSGTGILLPWGSGYKEDCRFEYETFIRIIPTLTSILQKIAVISIFFFLAHHLTNSQYVSGAYIYIFLAFQSPLLVIFGFSLYIKITRTNIVTKVFSWLTLEIIPKKFCFSYCSEKITEIRII